MGKPSKEQQLWQFASEIGADLVHGESSDDLTVVAKVKSWTIKLHALTEGYTTRVWMTAPYVSKDAFRFTVGRKRWGARLWRKLFGTKDIEVGYSEFDRDFFIRGNDESKLRRLFANRKIRELIRSQRSVDFEVIPGNPPDSSAQAVDILHYFVAWKVITDIERLKSLFELFEETLNHLCHMGSVLEEEPDVERVNEAARNFFRL